jgi:hypothetical protein
MVQYRLWDDDGPGTADSGRLDDFSLTHMFTVTSAEKLKGEQTPIDRKYLTQGTCEPFSQEMPEVTL